MTTREVTLSNFQLKQLFEEFNKRLNVPGDSAKYSWLIYKNCELMAKPYSDLINALYDERREPDFPAFYQAQQELVQKYADRDEQNNIIKNQETNQPVINENIVEFNQANNELCEKYSELCEKIKNKDQVNFEIFNKQNAFTLHCMELSEFPPQTPPFVVGILGD